MTLSVELLQELAPTEEVPVGLDPCCWISIIGCQFYSLTIKTCDTCTNTGS